jgi:hypothetical protein
LMNRMQVWMLLVEMNSMQCCGAQLHQGQQ